MSRKTCALIVLFALLAATLACNMPIQVKTPFPTPSTPVAEMQTATAPPSTLAPTANAQAPSYTPVLPSPSFTPPPTDTSIPPSLTPTSTETPTETPEDTFTPTNTPTRTRSPRTPTPPATLTPQPRPTRTRTSTSRPDQPGRTIYTAVYFANPPVLDGVWDEWTDLTGENPARNVVYGAENWSGTDDLDASFRVGWDENYLYLAVKVRDDVYVQNATGADLYMGDSLEVLLDTNLFGDLNSRSLSGDDYQLGISPGNPEAGINPEAFLWFPRSVAGPRGSVKIGAVRQQGVTRVEAAVPWSVFGIEPTAGDRYGFALSVSDNDNPNQNVQESMVSSAPHRSLVNPTTWNALRLK